MAAMHIVIVATGTRTLRDEGAHMFDSRKPARGGGSNGGWHNAEELLREEQEGTFVGADSEARMSEDCGMLKYVLMAEAI